MEEKFHSPTKGILTQDQVIKEIFKFLSEGKEKYSLVIGTDSRGEKDANFITAIIIHRHSFGGRYFWQRTKKKKVKDLRQRIYLETELSLKIAKQILEKLDKSIKKKDKAFNKNLEIHIDIGEVGPTRELIKEVVGWVQGNGFLVKTKPEAYGASIIADKYS